MVDVKRSEIWKAFVAGGGAFLAIYLVQFVGDLSALTMLMAPFGATCILVFALPDSPLAKARSVLGGHLISTFIGLLLLHTVGNHTWSLALGVGLALFAMKMTKTIHPPAGANPLLVMTIGASWSFLLTPVLLGAVLILIISMLYNRLVRRPA